MAIKSILFSNNDGKTFSTSSYEYDDVQNKLIVSKANIGDLYITSSISSSTYYGDGSNLSNTTYDFGGAAYGFPASGDEVFKFVAIKNITLSSNNSDHKIISSVGPFAPCTFIIKKNNSQIGTAAFATNSTSSTISLSDRSLPIGSVLSVVAPSPADTLLEDLIIVFSARIA